MSTPDGGQKPDPSQWLPPEAVPASSPAAPPVYGPPGYGQAYPPPAYGQTYPPQTYGQAYPPPYPPAYVKPRATDGFAVTGFVISLLGGMLIAVPFCIYGLRRIKRSGADGRGMAIAGLVISGLSAVVVVTAILAVVSLIPHRDDVTGEVTDGGYTLVTEVRPGDCLHHLDEGDDLFLKVVPCAEPHGAQAVHAFELMGAGYPGEAQAAEDAEEGCTEEMPQSIVEQVDDGTYDLMFLYPLATDWSAGDREVLCIITVDGTTMTGSLLNGNAT